MGKKFIIAGMIIEIVADDSVEREQLISPLKKRSYE